MFTTIQEVTDLTGITPTEQILAQAHTIMEVACGRPEARVSDADDSYWLSIATAYQAAYMVENADTVFTQIGARSIRQGSFGISLANLESPYIAPMAAMAINRLSWRRSRSVTTQPMTHTGTADAWEVV